MLWTEYRPVIKIAPKGALGSHEIRPIHSAPSLGQSIAVPIADFFEYMQFIWGLGVLPIYTNITFIVQRKLDQIPTYSRTYC